MASSRERGDRVVVFIGVFKLLKSALLMALGAAALWGVPAAALDRALHASRWTGALSGHRTVRDAVVKLLSMDAHTMRDLGVACLCYAAVFLVEGVGLLRGRRWAEWLTVVVTVSFMPVETYELVRHGGAGELAALVINGAIAVYLVRRRLRARAPGAHTRAHVSRFRAA
jgi:uncharacterized membrane protein (DUF2068 family)